MDRVKAGMSRAGLAFLLARIAWLAIRLDSPAAHAPRAAVGWRVLVSLPQLVFPPPLRWSDLRARCLCRGLGTLLVALGLLAALSLFVCLVVPLPPEV